MFGGKTSELCLLPPRRHCVRGCREPCSLARGGSAWREKEPGRPRNQSPGQCGCGRDAAGAMQNASVTLFVWRRNKTAQDKNPATSDQGDGHRQSHLPSTSPARLHSARPGINGRGLPYPACGRGLPLRGRGSRGATHPPGLLHQLNREGGGSLRRHGGSPRRPLAEAGSGTMRCLRLDPGHGTGRYRPSGRQSWQPGLLPAPAPVAGHG